MTVVTKTVRFDAAHVLSDSEGKCRNLHGHTYRVDVSVGATDEATDMVIDFTQLKRLMNELICARFDHAFIYHAGSADESEIAAVVERLGLRTARLGFRSTAENLARHFFELLAPHVAGLKSVKVWETADNCAEYNP